MDDALFHCSAKLICVLVCSLDEVESNKEPWLFKTKVRRFVLYAVCRLDEVRKKKRPWLLMTGSFGRKIKICRMPVEENEHFADGQFVCDVEAKKRVNE